MKNLFKSKSRDPLDETVLSLMDDEPATIDNQQAALDYMVELSDDEYDKLIKVAKIYREAQKRANDIMGIKPVDGDIIPVRVETNETKFLEGEK